MPIALLSVIAFQAWRYFPFAFLFILARLQAVPADLEEAAKVDGAAPLQRFRYILLPQLSTVIAVLAVLRLIWTFNEFDDIYLLTGGAAGTEVVSSCGSTTGSRSRRNVGGGRLLISVLAGLLAIFLFVYFRFFAKNAETSDTTKAAEAGTALEAAARESTRRPWTRERGSRRASLSLKWVGVVFFVGITAFPFLYMLLLSVRPIGRPAAGPRRTARPVRAADLRHLRRGAAQRRAGRAGLSQLPRKQRDHRDLGDPALLIAIPGAYAIGRLEFFGRRQVSALFLAVYLFPAILLAIPLFVLFTRIGLRGSLIGLIIVYASQTVPVTIYMLRTYFNSIPESLEESAAAGGREPLPGDAPHQHPAGDAGDHVDRPVRLHDRLERVPVRAAVPRGQARELDGVAGPLAAREGRIEVPTTVVMAGR